jgi:hypothetical protein
MSPNHAVWTICHEVPSLVEMYFRDSIRIKEVSDRLADNCGNWSQDGNMICNNLFGQDQNNKINKGFMFQTDE